MFRRWCARSRTSTSRPELRWWRGGDVEFMLVLCSGGTLVELTMDRAQYPRDYPPAFIYGLAAFYAVALVVELWTSKTAAMRAVERASGALR